MALGIQQDDIAAMAMELQDMAVNDPAGFERLVAEMESQVDELDEGHLVAYAEECIRESYDTSKGRRDRWNRLWEAHENEMQEYSDKEEWQNAIVLNKPFVTTVQATTLVRRGFMERPDYFDLDPVNKQDHVKALKAKFWGQGLKYWLGKQDSHFPTVFADAARMGFVMGPSMATKILWRPDTNGIYRLVLDNVDPRNIHADPDRRPRKPQSGLYLIHEEWKDLYQIYQEAEQGLYDVEQVKLVRAGRDYKDAGGFSIEDRDETSRRKGQQSTTRNRFRKAVCVRELWGGILDENGRLVMDNIQYILANGIVIKRPKRVAFPKMRWPIFQHSPLPHPLRFDGYGLWEGVMAMWKFQNNVLNLFGDNENWRINNMFEVDPSKLEDPNDTEVYPGKRFVRKKNAGDGPAVMPLLKGESNIQDVQYIWELATRSWDEGSFVTEPLKGAMPDQDRTLGELQMKFSQSMGVFDSIGKDVEQGAVQLIEGIKEVLQTFWDMEDIPSLIDVFGEQSEVLMMMEQFGLLLPEARMQEMALDADVTVQGISRLLDRADLIQRLQLLIGMGDNPRFGQFMKDYDICKRLFTEFNQDDLILSEEEVAANQRQQLIQQAVLSAVNAASGEDAGAQGALAPPVTPMNDAAMAGGAG